MSAAPPQVCCLLALQGAEAESFLRNHAEAESFLGQHTIPETTARNPLDYNKSVNDEMTTFYMENHFHCLEKDDWPRASAAIQSKDVFSMQCCEDSLYSTPCREVWCIHSPGEQIMNAWSDEDRCKRIGGLFGTRMSGGENKNACCHASCGVCGGLSCEITPATGLPDPVRASNCCLDQIIDKTTTNATTGVVTTYPNKACGSPPCVLGTNLVFPVGQAGLDAISLHIVNYAGDPCHTTSRDHLLRSLANLKVNELRIPDSTSSFEVTDMTRHGDEVYIVSNRVTEMGSATPVQPVCMVHKVNARTGKPMWPGPLKLNRHVVGSPVRFTSRGEFSQRRAEITVEEQRISGEWRMVIEAGITYITNPAGAHLNAGQDRTAYDDSSDSEISFGLKCAAGVTVKFQGHARSFSGEDGKTVKLQLFDDEGHIFPANAPVNAQFVQTVVDRFEWTATAAGTSFDVTVPSAAVYTVKLTKPSRGFAIRALRLVGGSEQVCYWLPKEVTNFMVVAFKDGFVAKYTDPVYDPALTTQLSPFLLWERHVTGAAQASVVVVGAPSVGGRWSSARKASSSLAWRDALESAVCVNEIGFDCSPWETGPGTTSSKRTDLPCTPQAASKCCICGRGEYLAIPTFEYVAVLDAGDGSALLGSKSLPTPATANSRTPSQYFKVPRGTYSQVRQHCRSASPPADLAVITGADENAMAQAACRFMNYSEGSCFIGLHRPPASSVRTPHEWITGEGGVFDSLVNNWKPGNINPGNQSDRPAAVIRVSDGTWDTALDSDEYAGVCAYTLPEVPAEVKNSWNPQLYGATFDGAEWAPNENVTTYFYKVSRTQGTKTAAMQGIGPFEIPGPWVLTTSKGVTMDAQRRMPFATDKCTKMDYSSGKVVDDPDCCASNATWVGCQLGYELIHREPGVGTEGCNTGSNRKTRCKRASYADFSNGYKLQDTPGGPFKFAVRGRYDRNYMLEARSVDSSKMLELTIHGTSGSPARTIRARQSVMAARGARAQGLLQGVPADPLGGYMQACANIGGILRDMPPPGSFTPGSELYACCPASCGACGGANCVNRTGGAPNCCTSDVNTANLACSNTQAPPCVFRGQEHFTSYTADVTWSGSPPGMDSTSSNNFEWELRLVYRPAPAQTYTCLTAADYPPAYNAVSENFLYQRGVDIMRERCESMNYLDDNFHYKWNGVNGSLALVASCTSSCVRGNIPAAWYWELHWDGGKRLELVADKLFNLQDLASVQGTSVEPLSVAQIKTHELPDTYTFSMVDVVWEDDEDDALSNYRIVYGTFGISLLLWDYQGAGKRLTEVWTAKHDGTSIATKPRIVWDHNGTQNDGALIYYGYGTMLYARVMLTTNNTGDQTFGMQPGALLWTQELHGDIVAPVNLEESGGLGVMYVSTSEPAILYGLKQATRSNETASIHPLGSGVNHAPPVLSNSRKAGQDPPSHIFVSMADKVHLISTG